MLGPVLGSIIYGYNRYDFTFYIFGCIITTGLIMVALLLPTKAKKRYRLSPGGKNLISPTASQTSHASRSSLNKSVSANNDGKTKYPYKIFLTNRRAILAIVGSMFAMIFMLFFDSIYSPWLKTEHHVSDSQVGKSHTPTTNSFVNNVL